MGYSISKAYADRLDSLERRGVRCYGSGARCGTRARYAITFHCTDFTPVGDSRMTLCPKHYAECADGFQNAVITGVTRV